MVAVTAVSNVLGTINPVAQIVAKAHAAGALVLVDAAQSVPHATTDVQAWGADFVAFSGHKMLGPSGVGVLYGRETLLDAMPPFLGGGSMIRRVTLEGFEPAELPAKFEAGTPPIVPALGLASAIKYLEQIGMDNIGRYESILTARAHQVLESVDGVRSAGPRSAPQGGDRQLRGAGHSRARRGSDHGSTRRSHSRRAPLHDASAQTPGHRRQQSCQLLLLQHARRNRPIGCRAPACAADLPPRWAQAQFTSKP